MKETRNWKLEIG